MINEKKHLYFIAIIPPVQVCEAVNIIKHDFANRFQSKHALKVVPHITLKSPFRLEESFEKDLINWFQGLQISVKPFPQELKDFGCFANNRTPVIYITPVYNNFLNELHIELILRFRNTFAQFEAVKAELYYKPHVTVAYRDLQHEQFNIAWSEYQQKNFYANFEVKSFWLLKHIKHKWETIAEFRL